MPLRDHFRPPLAALRSWAGVYGGWPMVIVQQLNEHLPDRFAAGPRVRLAAPMDRDTPGNDRDAVGSAEYEVRVHDVEEDRRLVAAVVLVAPSNKSYPACRARLVDKCNTLLRQRVSVVLVDLVTSDEANLCSDLLNSLGQRDPSTGGRPATLYAVALRLRPGAEDNSMVAWFHQLHVGQPLPTLPLWLTDELAVPLDLEASYERTCPDLRIV